METPESTTKILSPLQKVTLRDLAYNSIRDAIVNGLLKPGERIKERDVAGQLNISTTPVKEALRRLEQEGLVVNNSVSEAPPIEEIYLIRATLHGLGARLAAKKITPEELEEIQKLLQQTETAIDTVPAEEFFELFRRFHMLVVAASRNVFLFKFQTSIGPLIRKFRMEGLRNKEQARRGLAAHKAIANAIAEGDADRAEELMRSHILKAAQFILGKSSKDLK
jgi:DNA-binding GntR family transcriptional regulator